MLPNIFLGYARGDTVSLDLNWLLPFVSLFACQCLLSFSNKKSLRTCLSNILSVTDALRMLSQNQSELQPEQSSSSGGSSSKSHDTDKLEPGPVPGSSGAVTPVHNGTEEFLSTGRTGRRNAMPDILGEHAEVGTADLPDKLGALTTDPGGTNNDNRQAGPSTEQQHAG